METHNLILWCDFNNKGKKMIKILLPVILMVSMQAYGKADKKAKYSKVAVVHGMVCAFCSNSLEKKFRKNKAVKKIDVDLEDKKVSIKFKKGKSIEDAKLKKMITASGFKVVSINDYQEPKIGKDVDKK